MDKVLPFVFFLLISGFPRLAHSQRIPAPVKEKVDAAIAGAYQTAAGSFPCKVKSSGKIHMIHWQEVDRCLNGASERIDWEDLSKQFETLRAEAGRIPAGEFAEAVEGSLSAHAIAYNKVFSVKDDRALLPLTNSLLRFLPADSLHDVPVFDRTGTRVGSFSGVYSFERAGGLSTANNYKLTLFQYTDLKGNVQAASDKLLLDSFGVPWQAASGQPGYRLTSAKLNLKRD